MEIRHILSERPNGLKILAGDSSLMKENADFVEPFAFAGLGTNGMMLRTSKGSKPILPRHRLGVFRAEP